MEMKLDIGKTIKRLRMQNDFTQEDLARNIGVTPQAISRWESNIGYPDIELLPAIAAVFSVSADELLGIDKNIREKRLKEIHREIKAPFFNEIDEKQLSILREYAAEFPADETIRLALADALSNSQIWNDNPDLHILREAEQHLKTLASKAQSIDRRSAALVRLARLYLIGFKDDNLADETLWKLPSIYYARECVAASIYGSESTFKKAMICQNNLLILANELAEFMIEYIAYIMPNDVSRWEEKIELFNRVVDFYNFICGDNMLNFHCQIALIMRYISTYTIAMKKYDETLDYLEQMLHHYQKAASVRIGDRFSSPFTDQIVYLESNYDLEGTRDKIYETQEKMGYPRYDPIRNEPRFQEIIRTLDKLYINLCNRTAHKP